MGDSFDITTNSSLLSISKSIVNLYINRFGLLVATKLISIAPLSFITLVREIYSNQKKKLSLFELACLLIHKKVKILYFWSGT